MLVLEKGGYSTQDRGTAKREYFMLKFFRKIRLKLLDKSTFRKYLAYAVGEILLVVIGILIALQLNNYNNEFQEKKQELAWLNSLLLDLKNDERTLLEYEKFTKESAEVIRGLIEYIDDSTQVVTDTIGFLRNLKRAVLTEFFTPTATTYIELTSSGNISAISNRELMRALINYHQAAILTQELNEEIKRVKWSEYANTLATVIEPTIAADMTEDLFRRRKQWPTDEGNSSPLLNKKVSFKNIRSNPAFRHALARSLDYTILQRGDLNKMMLDCLELIKNFETELGLKD